MCDLIDLKSPDGKTVTGTKLASPLIPAPAGSANGDEKNDSEPTISSSGLNFIKRNSLDNNPFDNALTKTVEYIRKQDDPFEIVLEKALTYEERRDKNTTPKARTVDFKDDFTPKRKRYSDILKMNKTLDDSLMDAKLNIISEIKKKCVSPEIEEVSQASDEASKNYFEGGAEEKFKFPNNRMIPRLCVESAPLDSSILNQSAMNDSLIESSSSSDDNLFRSIITQRILERVGTASKDADFLVIKEDIPKLQKIRRSLSQGDKMSPRKFRQHRSRSIIDGLKVGTGNETENSICCAPSIVFEDSMNKAFLQTLWGNDASGISNLSNLSAITRLASVSSCGNSSNSSSAFSNRTANCAFIENSTGDNGARIFCEKIDGSVGTGKLGSNGSVSSITKSPRKESRLEKDLNDLIAKYSKLKMKSSESSINEVVPISRIPSIISGSGITVDKSDFSKEEEKLIDIDVFLPESNASPPIENTKRKSVSSTSSDSVFIDSDTIGKSILLEAKHLAKTFEELATKTSSSSTSFGDDLVNSRPHWNFDMLPVSDDEVNDLIELPKSPIKCDSEKFKMMEESEKSTSSSDAKSDKSMLKELETEFMAPEKKIIASTLLLDLERLVKSEDNPKAAELLKNLEKALGVKCNSNAELLATCFPARNDLTKSPKKLENSLGNENIKDENIEKSCENNIDVEVSESFEQLSLSDDKNLQNNLNVEKEINKSDKSLMMGNEKYKDVSVEKFQTRDKKDSCEKIHDDSIEAIKKQNQITDDQKMAVEILVGLGKLLTGENKDPMTSNLLKNLGIALNLASSNNSRQDENVQVNVKETKRASTPSKDRIATPPRKASPHSAFSRLANRRSLESSTKTKVSAERVMRKSMSASQTPTSTTPSTPRFSNTPLSADKSKAHLKEVKKRFSSDPSFMNSADKKSEILATNNRKFGKDIALKPVVSELARQDKPSSTVAGNVKNKLRKKVEPDVASKKGPMKAILPLGNMQRLGSSGKRIAPMNGSVTPPKPGREAPSAFAVTTSTPFPIVHLSIPKKSPKSKPMASSTPDDVGTKNIRRSAPQIPSSPGKNAFSCNISPVTSKTSETNDEKNSLNDSKSLKTSKIGTPSKSRSGSQLPKLSPMMGPRTSPSVSNRGQRRSEPLQSFLPRSLNASKSPREKIRSDGSVSPLNNSNKLGSKVKPLNLISKLRGRNASVTEKENYA